MQKSYTAPFYSGIQENGMIIINTPSDLLNDEDRETLEKLNVKVFNHDATKLALDIGKTELSTNMAMIGACAGVTKLVSLEALDGALQERFGKKFIASGGTASLDEAIKKKYKKKNDLLKANMECITESYSLAQAWAEKQENLQLVAV
jgi:pyruvate ferredoxin oxidoreductase gamma subunit